MSTGESNCSSRANVPDDGLAHEREVLARLGARHVALGSAGYPRLLAHIPDPPLMLRVRGELPGCVGGRSPASLSIVGSRRPTAYGRRQAERFAGFFAEHGFEIVSGGARGIDAIAHRTALACKAPTTVILGGGLGRVYPPEHEALFDEIVEAGGCVASEAAVDTPPRPALFPRRNRIISGLSLGVLVIEAAARSGALITARLAVEEQGREVLALPGRVEDPASAGCLRMLAEGWAALIRTPEEALEALEGASALLQSARTDSFHAS